MKRHKKITPIPITLQKGKKIVRIDEKTSIEVDASIPDEDARGRFFMRYNPQKQRHDPIVKEKKEVLVGSVENLEEYIENIQVNS